MKFIVSGAIALLISLSVFAQKADDDANVSLKEVKREFSFVTGNNEFPVNIKEESNSSYFCNSYSTEITVAEFYNDMESIDAVEIIIDGYKKHRIVPTYEYYESEGIFYSDARVCHFKLPIPRQGTISNVKMRKTIRDPKYFTSIHFMEPYPIADQEVVIRVPVWMNIELKEFNFEKYKIKKTVTSEGDITVHRFTMKNLPALKRESSSPGFTYYSPHIMVLCKSAEPKQGRQTYFNTLKDQYNWYRQLVLAIGNDRTTIKQGEPLSIRDEQRTRKIDVYMPFPRSIGFDMRITIPDGYTVEGIDALKTSVENETGYFKTDASINGNILTVTIKKSYLHGFEPASNWDKMLAFIDASNDFTNAKLLFKKN